jgi:phosphatidylglycerophosphate synthase
MSTRKKLQLGIYKVINPLVRLLIRLGLTPNMVTTIGLVLNIGVAIIFISGAEEGRRGDLRYVGWAGGLILFAGLFDMLDGQVARLGNMSSPFGALYDSVLDRYSELILFLGICYYLVSHHYFMSSLFAFIGLIGSMMVSYTRARAEGLGIEIKDGLMQRPERVIIVGVSALACGIASGWMGGDYKIAWPDSNFPVFETISIFTIPLTIMAFLANFTAIGRLRKARLALEARAAAAAATNATNAAAANNAPTANNALTANNAPTASNAPTANNAATGTNNAATPNGASQPNTSSAASGTPAAGRTTVNGATIVLLLASLLAALKGPAQTTTMASSLAPPGTLHPHPAIINDPVDTFPVPPVNGISLFYLQRTPNINTVVYELNQNNGMTDKDEPIKIQWIRYTDKRQRADLSWIQRRFAYGLKEKDMGNGIYELRFYAFKKVPLYLRKWPVDNKQHVFVDISGRQAILNRVYLRIDPGGSFWSPNVRYLEVTGVDTENGKELVQRIKV